MTDWNEHEDAIDDVISDSIDMDWTSRTGARAVVAWLNENAAAPAPSSLAGGEVQTLRTLLDNLVIAQGLSKEIRIHATDEARAYLYDTRLAALSPEAPAREGVVDTVAIDLEAVQRWIEQTLPAGTPGATVQAIKLRQAIEALTPRHEAPASPAWRDEYNRVEAIREAAEGQDRVARSTADPIAKSDAETQAAGHWTRYEREVAKLNAASGHEAPAKGAGELKNLHRLASQEADHLEREAEEADDNNWQDWAVTMRQGADYIRQLIRARSSAPEAREDGYRRVDLGMVAITIETMHRRIEELTGSRQSQYDGAVSLARDLYLTAAPSADKLRDVLIDLTSWFTKPVQGQNGMVWVIRAGERGADDALNAALAALKAEV